MAGPQVFISHGRPYDSYQGSKTWNELTLKQRRTIAQAEFEQLDIDIEAYVMSTGLKKPQASGIRSLAVASQMLNERMRLIRDGMDPVEVRKHLLSVFANTRFFREINNLLTGKAEETTDYDGVELERLAFTNSSPGPLDEALDMEPAEARRFIQSQLAILHKLPLTPKPTPAAPEIEEAPPAIDPRTVLVRRKPKVKRGWSLRNLFTCSEVRWIQEELYAFFDAHDYLVEDCALSQCLAIARDADRAKYSIRVDRMKPDQIALVIIHNVALDQVASGRNHTYRGVLSLIGQEYKRMFIDAVRESQRRGYDDEQEADKDIAEMKAAIKEAG